MITPFATLGKRLTAWRAAALLALVMMLGGYFATLNLFGWDADTGQHPDERFMALVAARLGSPGSLAEYLDSARNPLNPRNAGFPFYVYGLLPQTLVHYTAALLAPAAPDTGAPQAGNADGLDVARYLLVLKIGRAWSAAFALLSIALVFLLGRRLYSTSAGLLAAALLALSALPIQIAHFFTVDSAAACFALLSMYWAVRLAQGGGRGCALALGLSIGAAAASRLTLATLGLLAPLALAQWLWATAPGRPPRRALLGAAGLLALAGFAALASFRLLQPDAFVGSWLLDIRPEPRFVANLRAVNAIVAGQIDSPPSQQWVGRARYLFPLQNMIAWGMGAPLGLAAWAGWAWAGWQLLRHRQLAHLLPWAWVALFFGWQGGIFGATMRYYLPLYGLLALFAAWALLGLARGGPVLGRLQAAAWRWLPLAAVALATLGWAYAFTRIYERPHARVAAARWVHANIAPGARLTWEEWDDALPLQIDGRALDESRLLMTRPYAEDEPGKYFGARDANGKYSPGLLDQLDAADYVVLSSNRVYGSATRLPMRYPALTRYYHALFDGDLGFDLVADIHSYPTLFGLSIPDQSAEEAFTVYDHPRVLIFKKTERFSRQRAEQLITAGIAWSEVYSLAPARADRVPTALRLSSAEWPAYRAGGTWAALFDPASLANQLPWLAWLLALELPGLALFALLFRHLPGLPDRGFALAKTLALLLLAYAAWLLGSAHLLAFGPTSVWLCAGLLLVLGAAAGWRARHELRAFARERWATLLLAEQLFLLLWLSFVVVRALNPDLWHPARGGEKPMDLAFLTAVLKSPFFPPYDPWFAGGFLNYRYFGFVLVGALVHLTGVPPTTAYNLAVPTLFALTALGAWGAVYNLLAPRTAGRLRGRRLQSELRAMLAGALAVALVALAGSLTNALALLSGSAAQSGGRPEWLYWDATHFARPGQAGVAIEFPFFTFLYGDMQPHMLALPLVLAALGLLVAIGRGKSPGAGAALARRALGPWLVVLGTLALVLGALRAADGWDYPAYLALAIATIGLAAWRMHRRGLAGRAAITIGVGASLALPALSLLLFAPFDQRFAANGGIRLLPDTVATLGDLLAVNALWLFVLLSAAALLVRARRSAPPSAAALLPSTWALGGLLSIAAGYLLAAPDDVGRLDGTLHAGLQSWVLLASAAATALPWLWRTLPRGAIGWGWRAGAGLLIAGALAYPLSATPAHIADRFDARIGPTLDGMAFMQTARWAENERQFPLAEDAAAIAWMRQNIAGTPIVLEAETAPYRWAGRVSAYTGLPTLLGWPWHEQRQRFVALAGGVIDRRERLIARLYSGAEPAGATLRDLQLYGVEYVYVGQLERALYPAAGLAQLDALAEAGQITAVYRRDATVIYQVPTGKLPPAVLAADTTAR